MAYTLDTEDEENERRSATGSAAPRPAATIGGAGTGMQPGRPAAPAANQPAKTSTNFVSYDRVLGANKDAAKAYSQKAMQPLQAGAQKAKQNVATAQANYGQAVQAGTPKPIAAPLTPSQAAGTGQSADEYLYQQEQLKKKAAAQAAQTYTGPNSLADDAGWGDILSGASDAQRQAQLASQRKETGELQGDAGIQTLLEEQVSGPYTKGQSKLDAALLGSTGRGDWDKLSEQYGSILTDAKAANEASKLTADSARAAVAAQPNHAQAELDRVAKEQAARLAASKAKTDAYQGWKTGLGLSQGKDKAQDWKTYNETNRFENTLGDIGEMFDPISHFAQAGGGPSHHVAARDAMDGAMNQNGATVNSNKVNWGATGQFGSMPENVKASVYNSLSKDELHALERMGGPEAAKFVSDRIAQLGREAMRTLQDPKFAGKSDSEIFLMLTTQYGIHPAQASTLFEMRDAAKKMGVI